MGENLSMARAKSSILSVHYTSQIDAKIGDLVEDVCHPDSFDIEVESGKNKFSIKNLRFSLPDIQGIEVEESFEADNIYNQTIYTMIPGLSKFSATKIAINGRPVNEAETILMDQDMLVLRRDIKVVEPKLKMDSHELSEDLNDELSENTNSVWSNERIDPVKLFARNDIEEIPIFDTFGNIKSDDYLVAGEAFNTHIKRTNKLENVEFYKVFEDRYVHIGDVVAESDLVQNNDDPELKEILEQEKRVKSSRDSKAFKDNFEEVEPFKIKFKNAKAPLFYNFRGEELDYAQPEVGAVFTVTGILHGVVDFYQIELDKFVLEDDVERIDKKRVNDPEPIVSHTTNPIIDDEITASEVVADAIDEDSSSEESSNSFNKESEIEDSLAAFDNSELEVIGNNEDHVYDYNEEIAKTDAHAVKNEFMDAEEIPEILREGIHEVNGIVQVKGDDDEKVDIYNSYKSDRELVPEKVVGGTFWYTNEMGNDDLGNHYYKIAVGTWIPEESVKYFDK